MKLDHFGRSCVDGIQELASLGVQFIATSQGLDTDESNPASKLLMHILAGRPTCLFRMNWLLADAIGPSR
jgi:hypothetical protein